MSEEKQEKLEKQKNKMRKLQSLEKYCWKKMRSSIIFSFCP